MSLPIYRLRRWLAVIAILFIAMVAGTYFYARMRLRNVLKELPNKIGIDIKQTANGFQFSKSDGKRTLFTVEASDLKQFKLNGHAELHKVNIILYGRDSSRFDQIYGDDFTYDKDSGNVSASGEVQIDLEANPSGQIAPDQAAPKDLKNPIHHKTRDLVFNQNSGDASTNARVDFRTPQATGWAVGMQYSGKSNMLTLLSDIHITLGGDDSGSLFATHGTITRDPRIIVLDQARLERESGTLQAEKASFFLGTDNEVQRIFAEGNVKAVTKPTNARTKEDRTQARADQAELLLTGKQNLLRDATLTGNVHVERLGEQPMQADAGRALLNFAGRNELQKVHASDGVHLAQHATSTHPSSENSSPQQDLDITAPIIDFFVAGGKRLDQAQTSGAAKIVISPAQSSGTVPVPPQRTVITAARFDAKFASTPDGAARLKSVHGAPAAKIVSSIPGIPDRVSTSETLDAAFLPEGGISSIVQQGTVVYDDGQPPDKRTQAWADKAVYTLADAILVLTGNPRVAQGSMVTTAKTIRMNRTTDDAFAEGDVKTTYSDLKEQPSGALLASSSPIHVSARAMSAHNSPAVALYQGDARLWQDSNIIEAPSIEFHRDPRSLIAQGNARQPVTTVLVQARLGQPASQTEGKERKTQGKAEEKSRDSGPVTVTSARLTYSDTESVAHYEGGVMAKGTNFTASSNTMDAYLIPRSQTKINQQLTGPGQLDHMVAKGTVVIQQPGRRALGQNLVYTASDDKFVLTGGPPSIFDAERGKITGVSLTFFRTDDRVLVEGEKSTPVVTQTRVVR